MSLLFVGSEQPKYRDSNGYAGAHGRLLDRMLRAAGLSRDDAEVINAWDWRDGMEREFDVAGAG